MRLLFACLIPLGFIACKPPIPEPPPGQVYFDKDGTKFYFKQVEVKFQPAAPEYPPEAKAAGIQGVVELMILIDREGLPFKVEILKGPPELHANAEAFAMKWRFHPALMNGKPEIVRFKLTVPYKLD